MSGVARDTIKRAGDIEYAFALNHANGKIKCFFCKAWHHANGQGGPVDPITYPCVGRAARFKSIVIVARKDTLGVRSTPDSGETQRAIKHGIKEKGHKKLG